MLLSHCVSLAQDVPWSWEEEDESGLTEEDLLKELEDEFADDAEAAEGDLGLSLDLTDKSEEMDVPSEEEKGVPVEDFDDE